MKDFTYFIISFIECDISEVGKAVNQILINRNYKVSIDTLLDLDAVVEGKSPQKGGLLPMKAVLYTPSANESICALYANSSDGWQTLVTRLSTDLGVRCWTFSISGREEEYPKNGFEVIENGYITRKVAAYKEWDGWEFIEVGKPLPFEDTGMYKKRSRKDRVTLDSTVTLAKSYGLNFYEDESFFRTNRGCWYIRERR